MSVLTFEQFAINESAQMQGGELGNAKGIIRTLRNAGFQAYLVGGCVRDMLLGRKPKDYDVATDARPEQVLKLFPEDKGTKKVGAHFGVVIHQGIEIATFRSDHGYSDGRRPDSVSFETDPKQDALRRDFTSNALFMDPFTGEILDHVGGHQDIKDKLLRAVGDPAHRFGEDNIRMMRAVRFASKLGFNIHPETFAAIQSHAGNIKKMAIERITDELVGSLEHDPGKTFEMMDKTELMPHVLPEVSGLGVSAYSLTRNLMQKLGKTHPNIALAALFSQLDLKVVERMADRLKLSNVDSRHILDVLALQPRITASSVHTTMDVVKKLIREPFFTDAMKLYEFCIQAHDPHVRSDAFHFLANTAARLSHDDLHPQKFVTGDDLIALGMKPGKQFKELLDKAENGQLTGRITSKAQALELIRTGRL